jgi:hypothetical protein
MEAEVHLTDCRKRFFGSPAARMVTIEMTLHVCDDRMCFDPERRIVLTEANFVTCVDRLCAFHWSCPMDEHIVPQRRASPLHSTNKGTVYLARCLQGGELYVRDLKGVR